MTREEVHDTQIGPLMTQIIDICREHEIPFIAQFALDDNDELMCTSYMAFNSAHMRRMRTASQAPNRASDVLLSAIISHYDHK